MINFLANDIVMVKKCGWPIIYKTPGTTLLPAAENMDF